jgi:hypothetical protein
VLDGNTESATGLKEAWAFRLMCHKEEGGYEYASYHSGTTPAEKGAIFGLGVEVQEGEGQSPGKAGTGVVPMCGREIGTETCARYVDGAENRFCLTMS